jgi:7-keto-8-aminopelargonate synthetase-like enzyme
VDGLALTPVAKMVAKAAQKYGFIVTDKAGAVSVIAESGAGVQAKTGVNPWNAIMGSTPSYLMMRNFPWDKLQALPRNYGKP